ncbi:MAG: mersacidin/lichenicidin family type 2 lantibiotic [Ktedonobacteraceae bacterium]
MSIDEIISAWKADDDDEKDEKDEQAPANPAGEQELSDEELEQASGGMMNDRSCLAISCW